MGNFNRDYRTSGGGGRDFNRGSGGSRPREMFRTTCSNCGRECEVPFKPNGNKPVFCSDCFEKNGGGQSNRFNRNYDRPQNFERPQSNNRPEQENAQLASLNAKLDRIITLLIPKPAYQDNEQPTEQSVTQSQPQAPVIEKRKRAPKKTTTSSITA